MPYKKVLIAIDSSETSLKAAEHGLNLSSQLEATSAFVFVIDTEKARGNLEAGILPQDELGKLKREANATFKRIATKFPEHTYDSFMPEDKPSRGIVKIAEDWGADLIVMGTQGKSGLKRLILGSTAENIIRLSPVPILVVPSKA